MSVSRVILIVSLLSLSLAPGASSLHGAEGIAEKRRELKRIKREMQEKKQELKKAGRRERSVLGEMERLDQAIQRKDAELLQEQKGLRRAQAELADVERSASVLKDDLGGLKKRYRRRVRALYKMGRSGYAVGILSSENMTAAVKRMKYMEIIAEQDRAVITKYRNTLDSLSQQQAEIDRWREDTERRRHQLSRRQQELAAQRRNKAKLLASVRREKGLYEQVLDELEQSSDDLWASIKREEERLKAARRVARGTAGSPSSTVSRGRLPWPASGKVVTPYGRQQHPRFGTTVFRRGIEIAVPEGQPVKAVSAGRVAFADWYKGYGKLLIVQHSEDLYSLYGYLSRIDVVKGGTVVTGQVVGLAGDTGSARGGRLYFEIRRKGKAEDPLAWLAKR